MAEIHYCENAETLVFFLEEERCVGPHIPYESIPLVSSVTLCNEYTPALSIHPSAIGQLSEGVTSPVSRYFFVQK